MVMNYPDGPQAPRLTRFQRSRQLFDRGPAAPGVNTAQPGRPMTRPSMPVLPAPSAGVIDRRPFGRPSEPMVSPEKFDPEAATRVGQFMNPRDQVANARPQLPDPAQMATIKQGLEARFGAPKPGGTGGFVPPEGPPQPDQELQPGLPQAGGDFASQVAGAFAPPGGTDRPDLDTEKQRFRY